jgi:protein-tyrosine-phosphatase
MKVLILCSANFGRSQSLAYFLQEYAREHGLDLEVKSAGTNKAVIDELAQIGVRNTKLNESVLNGFDKAAHGQVKRAPAVAKPVSEELVNWADRIFAVDQKVMDKLAAKFPHAMKKTLLAKEFVAGKKLPLSAGFKDAHSDGKAKRFRQGTKQSTLKNPQPKAFRLMSIEAKHLARGIGRRLR